MGTIALVFPTNINARTMLFYRAKPKDTLTEILFQLNLQPIYGPQGSLYSVLKVNPQKSHTGGHYIRPGEKIYLPEGYEAALQQVAHITPEGEVLPGERPLVTNTSSRTSPTLAALAAPPNSRSPEREPTAAMTPVEKPPEPPQKEKDPSPESDFSFGTETLFNTLAAQDPSSSGSAIVNLKSGWGFQLGWKVLWTENFSTFAEWKSSFMEYSPSNNSLKELQNRSLQRHRLSLGGEHLLGNQLRFRYRLGYGPEVFLYGVNSNAVRLDLVPLTSLGSELDFEFLRKGSTSLSSVAEYQYFFGKDTEMYRVESGSRLSALLRLSRDFESSSSNKSFNLSLGVRKREQNTTVIQQSEEEIFALLQFLFHIRGSP